MGLDRRGRGARRARGSAVQAVAHPVDGGHRNEGRGRFSSRFASVRRVAVRLGLYVRRPPRSLARGAGAPPPSTTRQPPPTGSRPRHCPRSRPAPSNTSGRRVQRRAACARCTDTTYRTLARRSSPAAATDRGSAVVARAPDHMRTWVADASSRRCGRCRRRCSGRGDDHGQVGAAPLAQPAPLRVRIGTPRAGAEPTARLNPKYTFEQFVIGERQPPRPRRRARRRRAAGAGVQPALPLRPAGPRQDAPAARHRQLRPRPRRGMSGPLHDRRGLHERTSCGALQSASIEALQGRLPRHGHPADRRRPVPPAQGEDRGGVLPHVQRAVRDGQPARPHVRSPAADMDALGTPARALRGRPRRRLRAARPATRLTILRKRVHHDGSGRRRRRDRPDRRPHSPPTCAR